VYVCLHQAQNDWYLLSMCLEVMCYKTTLKLGVKLVYRKVYDLSSICNNLNTFKQSLLWFQTHINNMVPRTCKPWIGYSPILVKR